MNLFERNPGTACAEVQAKRLHPFLPEMMSRSTIDRCLGPACFEHPHGLSAIRNADQVIFEQGNHQALLDAKGFYYDLYVSQFKGIAI